MFSATHFLKGLSCLNSPGTPQQLFAALRRQPNSTEKSVNATISYAEQRPFKTPQLPALRAVVSEPAPQKRRFFLLLFLSPPSSLPETWKSAGESGSNRWGKPHVILPFEEEGQCRCEVSRSFATQPQQGLRLGFAGMDASPPPFVRHSGSQGQTGVELLGAQ